MKIKSVLSTLFIVLITISIFSSCEKQIFCKKGNGEVISITRSINNFQEIDFEIAGDLIIKQSDTLEITIEAQENLINEIETIVSGNVLTIKTDGCIKTDKTIKVFVSVPNITRLNLKGSGDIYQDGNWDFTNLKLTISGSGNIKLNKSVLEGSLENHITGSGNIVLSNTLISSNLSNKITGSGDIIISNILGCKNSNSIVEGSGDISISSVDTCSVSENRILGSGDIHTRDFPAKDVSVKIDGSGSTYVHAIEILDVDILGSGNVYYIGQPLINVEVSGSGSLINSN